VQLASKYSDKRRRALERGWERDRPPVDPRQDRRLPKCPPRANNPSRPGFCRPLRGRESGGAGVNHFPGARTWRGRGGGRQRDGARQTRGDLRGPTPLIRGERFGEEHDVWPHVCSALRASERFQRRSVLPLHVHGAVISAGATCQVSLPWLEVSKQHGDGGQVTCTARG